MVSDKNHNKAEKKAKGDIVCLLLLLSLVNPNTLSNKCWYVNNFVTKINFMSQYHTAIPKRLHLIYHFLERTSDYLFFSVSKKKAIVLR